MSIEREQLSKVPTHSKVEFCILKETEIEGYSGVIVTPPSKESFLGAPIVASNSYYGKENVMKASFLGSDGVQDFYEITTRFPNQMERIHQVTYQGNELIVRQHEGIEMLLRPKEG